jgi:MOSC domain-containing protein YiiM
MVTRYEWTADDVAGTLRAAEPWWNELVVAGTPPGPVPSGDVEDVVRVLREAGRALPRLRSVSGRVVQLNVSDGGVPKQPVESVRIGMRGVEGDRQAARLHHGRPWQALCLWSLEVIEALQAEGHPIAPGLAGENVTIGGIDWSQMRPGVRLRIGSVVAETSIWSVPCKKNAGWFVGGDFRRIDYTRDRSASRMYAWVVEPGEVRVGDPVVVEP